HIRSLKTAKPGARRALQPALAVTSVHSTPAGDDQPFLLHSVPGPFRPPISHILFWKTSETGRSVCPQGPASSVRVQLLPSGDFHTSSRLGLLSEIQAPRIPK